MKRILAVTLGTCLLFSSLSVQASKLSNYAGKKLHQASELQQEDKLNEAIVLLEGMSLKSDYDKAFTKRILGVYYWQSENAAKAIKSLDVSVKVNALQPVDQWKTRQMLADILFSEQKFKQAIPHYLVLLKTDYPASDNNVKKQLIKDKNAIQLRMSMAYYQQQNWKSSLARIKQYKPSNSRETLQALKIRVVSELQLERWKDAEKTVNRILRFEPNQKSWWQQLVSTQLQQGKQQSALETYALSKYQGIHFTINEYIVMAQLYGQHRMPEKAARILKEMFAKYPKSKSEKNLRMQANYWQVAKEWDNAISAWQTVSKINPKYHWRLAQLLIQQSRYQQAIGIIDKARPYADRRDFSLAKIRLLYKLNRFQDALAEAKRLNEKIPSDSAKGWISYLSNKVSS
ncbi:tetratricopeptide repeat protein [Vibrio nigripulchritudo]|uniref:tetratricopeptide repeat protein n=1 Tax=Vibrio nigripulchritudo TaxID=28173 RepID=UPI0005F9CAE9|nr:tetratricopeptide repeat protein [Vibrio nigripulchritudo]KJY80548.1 hypothetical protein TW74_05400 [Vibrio nigripulchritudo]